MFNKIERYLGKYSPNQYQIVSEMKSCSYAVVVPAIAEFEYIKRFIDSFAGLDPKYFSETLLLFVINNSAASSNEVKENNKKSIQLIQNSSTLGINLGYIDASSPGHEFPVKDAGVGLARKTGMDAVLSLFKEIRKAIIICTDADCTFEKNYLTTIVDEFTKEKTDAAVIDFRHKPDIEETAEAVVNYEIFLRYYVVGLRYSGSPYAFHTVGSSMACSAEAYMNIEGMNKRKAAEDFYFLEKLAKRYPVKIINNTTVYPSSRRSWRVPFGTGQRMNRFLSNIQDEYVLYHPECFSVLSGWHEIFFKSDLLDSFEYLSLAEKVSKSLHSFLLEQGFEKDWNNIIKNNRDRSALLRQKVQWFDGFRTLKLIHYLRDNEYGTMKMSDALKNLLGMLKIDDIPHSDYSAVELHKKYLEILRKIDN